MRRFAGLGIVVALAATACGPTHIEPSDPGESGLELSPISFTPADQPSALLTDGGPIELIRAPQGGHVFMVGAQIKNSDSTTMEMSARVRDAESGALISEAKRTVVMQPLADDATTIENDRRSMSQMVHVNFCPRDTPYDLVGRPIIVEVSATELYSDFSEGAASVQVIPSCTSTDPYMKTLCECECSAEYEVGMCGGELG